MRALRTPRGFSLIEIVIALGVASFAIVAILGLMSVSFSTEKAASEDTEIAMAGASLLSQLRNRPFDDLLDTLDSEPGRSVLLDDTGSRVSSSSDAAYRGTYQYVVDSDTMVPSGPPNLIRVRLALSPARGPATPHNTKVFHACFARH